MKATYSKFYTSNLLIPEFIMRLPCVKGAAGVLTAGGTVTVEAVTVFMLKDYVRTHFNAVLRTRPQISYRIQGYRLGRIS